MDNITNQLKEMRIKYDELHNIQNKNGILLFRVICGKDSFILKYFNNSDDCREIENYHILNSLQIPTPKLMARTDCCLLLEDIGQSDFYRLGIADDLDDVEVAVQIAKWYKNLHEKGKSYVANYSGKLYDETDFITKENISFIKSKTMTENASAWSYLDENFDFIRFCIEETERTLTYNDFYYTNLIVAKNKSSALMFDYNLLGKGYIYSDIRNVCSSLGMNAKKAFLDEYGYFDSNEIILDEVASILTTLYFACKRTEFPQWAEGCLVDIKGDGFYNKLQNLINYK